MFLPLHTWSPQEENGGCGGGGGNGRPLVIIRFFMAPHLIRAQSTHKDIRIHSSHTHAHRCMHALTHTHTHTTNTCITGDGLVKTTDQHAEEKRLSVV